jgi:small-conductance mechanosensitive channel
MERFKNPEFRKVYPEKIITIYFALFLLAPCLLTKTQAQNTTPQVNQSATNASPQASATTTPIPFSDIIVQAENASSTLKEIAASASTDPATETIEQDLPALTGEINARLEETALTVEGSTSLDNLRSFEADWRTLTRNLPEWKTGLTNRARKLEADLRRLDDLSEKWQKTLEELRNTETPPEVLARVEEIIASAANTRRLIITQQARLVSLQNRIAEQQNRVEGALKTIGAKREALVGQLLVQDSPPIWSRDLWTRTGIRQGIRDSLSAQFEGLNAFATRNRDKLIIHILVFVLLAGVLFYLRRWAQPLVKANLDLKQSAVIFYLPIPTALVLAILFNSRIYPQTPQILGAIFGAIALIPTIIILRKLVEPTLYPLLYSLVIFYFVDQLRAISEGAQALARPLFLAEILTAFLFFLWFYRTRLSHELPPEDVRQGQVFRVVRTAALLVLPFFVVAFLANAFGYVNLARLVGNAVLRSAYVAVILYAIVRIIDGLIVFALRFRPLNLLKMVRDYAPEFQAKLQKSVRFIAFVLWLLATLEFFTLREVVFRETRAILTAELNLGSLSISAFDVLLFFAVVWASFLLSRFVRFALEEDVYPRFDLAHGIPYAISTIINYLILLVGFFFAIGAAGFDLTRFTVLAGAFGVGIGFGLQNIVNNFVSGLILLFERPVKVGDVIQIADATGTVQRIGIRASIVRVWDNSEIIVPNSKLIADSVTNWTFSSRQRGIEIPVSAARGIDPRRVLELLKEIAVAHPLVADTPVPQALFDETIADALKFRLRVWTNDLSQALTIRSDLVTTIHERFAADNILIPPPAPAAPPPNISPLEAQKGDGRSARNPGD